MLDAILGMSSIGRTKLSARLRYPGADVRSRIHQTRSAGPGWPNNVGDIRAKIPQGVEPKQMPDLLRALLEDRFKLKVSTRRRSFRGWQSWKDGFPRSEHKHGSD